MDLGALACDEGVAGNEKLQYEGEFRGEKHDIPVKVMSTVSDRWRKAGTNRLVCQRRLIAQDGIVNVTIGELASSATVSCYKNN